ncbi:Zinc finger PMZ-type [Arabidopsis thaliana x Arabidopsis arenosa]|uniref:Zinc finger PMZ-type n=1 Tax=Arabidopsis thaliana x Arabidopsis arenosa TaxID=1240361 RepID=A0A8T2BZ24_9BRAS|nr:Zinc finger PMZ-type [Arabidopsis thaliana x Arabidopsis arenosa]
MNMYVSVDEDEDDLPERGGQSELSAYDENVLRAVAIAETGHRGKVDEIEQVYRAINVKRGRGADYLEEVGANSGETLVSCEISEDYDFDKMRDRIDREYPVDWDPYNTKRVKSWSAAGDSEVRVEDDGTNISGGKRITTEGTSAAIGGENIRVSPDARTRAFATKRSRRNKWCGDGQRRRAWDRAGDGPETAELLSIELAQEVMSPVMIYSACETITQENTDAEGERQLSPILRRRVGDGPDGGVADADDGSGSSRRPTQMSDYGLSLRGRKNVAAEDLGNVSSGGPELVDEEQLENLSMSPIGNNLGAEHGDSTGPEEGALALMAIGNQRMTPRRRFNVGVGEESTLNYNAMCEIPEDDPIFLGDATPFKDNAVAVAGDKANMNLRKSEDCMYIGGISASDKTRVIAVCGDRKCRWRIYATYHKDSESVEIRTATLKHTCDVEARSKYGKKATASILGELLKAKYAHGKKGPRACELPEVVLSEINVSISYMKACNISESLNAALQKAIDFPIVTLVESIRTMLMRWFCERREKAKKALTRCTPEIEQLLIDHLKEATDCAVIASTEWIYQVNDGYGTVFTVDLRKKTCTCRVFDVLMVPCCHALAAVGIRNVDIYSLVGKYAFVSEWRKLWTEHILPPPKERDTEVPLDISQVDVNAPKTKRPSGRPRTVRIPSQGEHHLRNDEHTFKWVDEALLNEIDTLKGKNGELEQEVKEIKTQRLEFEKEIFEKLPKHLRVSIVLLVGKTCYRHLGPLILSGKAGMRLALDPSVLRETSLALLESHPQNISIGSPIHLFVLRCVKARNPVACYLESIRLAAVEGLIKEAMDMLGDIPDPSPKILFTKGLYLVSVNRPMDAITAMNQFKHEVVSSRNADRVATLVMTDIKKIAPDQLRFTWTGYTCYLIHPPRRYSECSKCNFWNPCPLCVNWWVL